MHELTAADLMECAHVIDQTWKPTQGVT